MPALVRADAIVVSQATLLGMRQTLGKFHPRTVDEATHLVQLLMQSGCTGQLLASHIGPATKLLEELREQNGPGQQQ